MKELYITSQGFEENCNNQLAYAFIKPATLRDVGHNGR
jgi:hypothetical protein